MKIPISKIEFTEQDKQNILKPLNSGWVVQGPFVREFEQKWSEFTKAKHSIAVSNCTTALHLCLAALNIGYGDQVIVPAFTWVATANAVESLGAIPVFCDIDLTTFNIDVNNVEALISAKTKAIIPVHLFGLSANMDPLFEIAKKYRLDIIEDAACGFGAKYKGTHVGNFGIAGCFSFHPRKAITTGEGGMITTNDDEFAIRARSMRDHGATTTDLQRHLGARPHLLPDFPFMGFNYRMTDIQGSIGSTQMDRALDIHHRRIEIAKKYDKALEKISWLRKTDYGQEYTHGYQAYVCLFAPKDIKLDNVQSITDQRNCFMEYLQTKDIATRPGTHAVHMLTYYKEKYKIKKEDFPNAYIADHCSIALPIFPSLNDDEFNYIVSMIQDYKL